ncbi:hypothetical protein [Armatimonas sp.]|uniref:hypothetical protein n=1 Tax=Armatimonas sp. TaxID=1872638 RepID=UPI00286B4D6E|nr:hypothetical protein [Armatimonas sp.]
MKDDDIRAILTEASFPEPIGGAVAARERLMGTLRHHYPPEKNYAVSRRSLRRPLGAIALAGVMAVALLLVWPEQKAEADPLPSEAQMQQFYDQHETTHVAHSLENLQGS